MGSIGWLVGHPPQPRQVPPILLDAPNGFTRTAVQQVTLPWRGRVAALSRGGVG